MGETYSKYTWPVAPYLKASFPVYDKWQLTTIKLNRFSGSLVVPGDFIYKKVISKIRDYAY